MKKNGAFVQKIWLQERPKEHLQIYMTVKAGRHCRITLRQTAELIGSCAESRWLRYATGHRS